MKLISRSEAKAIGRKTYYTGKPCKKNHLSERQTSNGICVTCRLEKSQSTEAKDYQRNYAIEHRKEIARNQTKYLNSTKGKAFQKRQNKHQYAKRKDCPKRKAYMKDYQIKYQQLDHVKQTKAEYNARADVVKRQQEYSKAYCSTDAYKQYLVKRRSTPEYRAYMLAYLREYRKLPRIKAYGAMRASLRRSKVKQATPNWLMDSHFNQMQAFYVKSAKITQETGIQHHVDHIVPIMGELVCGLNVPWNMQILTATENIRKSNKF